jgi:predicted glycoside hydrolase/deacetylase ChbG (UPF0249 family)/predicted nicotinamide N-methyase
MTQTLEMSPALAEFEPRSGTVPAFGCRPARAVIIEADDLGLTHAFNEGIRLAHQSGLLTSTCLRANGYAYDHAIKNILPDCPKMGVGVHLCLNEASPCRPARTIPLLCRPDGQFRSGFTHLISLARRSGAREQIEQEFRAQIERVLADGVRVDHLNSHQHVHMIPDIFRITCRLAAEYGIPCVRLAREPSHWVHSTPGYLLPLANGNIVKRQLLNGYARRNARTLQEYDLLTTDSFAGVLYTGTMTPATAIAGLKAAASGMVELLLHPTTRHDPRDTRYPSRQLRRYCLSPRRSVELATLTGTELADFLRREGWMTTTFAELPSLAGPKHHVETPPIPDELRHLCESTPVTNPPWVSAAHRDARAFAQLVVSQAPPGGRVLDMGTGTGICAICLARSGFNVVATDLSAAAVRTAQANARANKVDFPCYVSDLLAAAPGRFDLIAFNLPYNVTRDTLFANLAKNALRAVPWVRSRSGSAMPLAVIRFHQRLVQQLMEQLPDHLEPGGALLLHVYRSEVGDLSQVLPPPARLTLLRHPDLHANDTVGMLIRP